MSEAEQAQRDEALRPKFDGTVNLGHVLTALLMFGGGLTVWRQSIEVQAKQDARIQVVENNLSDHHNTLRQLTDNQQLALQQQAKLTAAMEYLLKKP